MRLNPRFPLWYYYVLGQSQFMLTRYNAAIESFEKAIERNPTSSSHEIFFPIVDRVGAKA